MHFRRSAATLVAAAALLSTACQTKLDDRGVSQHASFAVFDPSTNTIPLPNDLALASAVSAGCASATTAQMQFLCALAASGGFPNDQEVPLTFAFHGEAVTPAGSVVLDPLALDTTTVRVLGAVPPAAATVAVFDVTGAPTTVTPVVVEATFVPGTSTLRLRKPAAADGSRRWAAGHRYAAFVLGGPSGVKAVGGAEVEPMPTMFVLREAIVSNRDLTDPANQTLIPGTPEEKATAGARLEPIRRKYLPLKGLVDGALGAGSFANVVNLLTFAIAPSPAVVVEVDAVKGSAPLPIDLLRAPDAAGGLVLDNPAYGAARTGIVTLDGFSTTAPITAPLTGGATLTAGTIDAGTVNGANVLLFEVGAATTQLRELKYESATAGAGGNPAAAAYVAQPPGTYVPAGVGRCPATSGGCATSIVLQPAVAASENGPFLPPLKGGTKYAVVVTNRVKDLTGRPLGRSTAARIVLDVAAPVDASLGIDAGTAALLQQMRTDLAPVWSSLPAGTTRADVVMAYVFRTQTTTGPSLQLSALPYSVERAVGAAFTPQVVTSVTASYPGVTGAAAIYEVLIPSLDVTSHVTGALDPAVLASTTLLFAHQTALRALVAVPDASNPNIPYCSGGTSGPKCAPLVVYGHGLHGSKASLLVSDGQAPASALLAQGFVVAAIDFPQHGDRAWCLADSDCATGTCTHFTTPTGAPAYQGDVDPGTGLPAAPGLCSNHDPKPSISGQTFVSANFFRTRDMFRQNVLDQSALVLALARPPTAPQPAANPFTAALESDGIAVAVNPAAVYWQGISLGGIAGTEVLATNPRFSRGVTSVAGGTLVDVFTHSPAFASGLTALFSSLLKPQLDAVGAGGFDAAFVDPSNASSFTPAIAAAYGKTLLVAKWIFDPGEPLNYARALRTAPLPNLLADPTGRTAQAAKAVLGQVAIGDLVIPNTQNRELFALGAVDQVEYTSLGYPASYMHGLLDFDPTVQAQAASYLFDLTRPPAPPTRVTVPPAP